MKADLLFHLEKLLALPVDAGRARPHIEALAEMLAATTGVSVEDKMNASAGACLDTGVAITPAQAAKCLRENLRTQVFLKGVAQAMADALNEEGRVAILYAGTGPYGLLVLPLVALMLERGERAEHFQLSLIDIHDTNIRALEKVVKALGLEAVIEGIYQADATQWQAPGALGYDLIVSETMNVLLLREPQLSIFSHLQQYLTPGGSLIPQEISLHAGLRMDSPPAAADDNQERQELPLGCFFRLDRAVSERLFKGEDEVLLSRLKVPEWVRPPNSLTLTTEIQVYQEHRLGEGQCSLTMPIHQPDKHLRGGDQIRFVYEISTSPRFQIDIERDGDGGRLIPETEEAAIAPFEETGRLKLCHLKRFWQKISLDRQGLMEKALLEKEWGLDVVLVEQLGGSLQSWLDYLYQCQPAFEQFECWVGEQVGVPDAAKVAQLNRNLDAARKDLRCVNSL